MKKWIYLLFLLFIPIGVYAVETLPDLPGGTNLEAYVATWALYTASVLALTELLSIWIKVNRVTLVWILAVVVGGAAFFLGYGVFDAWYFAIINIVVGAGVIIGYLTAERGQLIVDVLRDFLKHLNEANARKRH